MPQFNYSYEVKEKLEFDRHHIWHPYTSIQAPLTVYPVKSASGCRIVLDTEEEEEISLVDGMSSWWSVIHGYNNREINEAAKVQLSNFSHVMFGGFTHSPAITLTQKLIKLIDHKNLKHCFLADSGSVAVEISIKLALQHNASLFSKFKFRSSKILTVRNGYHGDTLGAMSVCDPVNSMHGLYDGYFSTNIFAESPPVLPTLPTSSIYQRYVEYCKNDLLYDSSCIENFETKLIEHQQDIVAIIIEPLVQGAGGMRLYHPQFLIDVKKLCIKYKKLLIMDEIATGFGRTGQIFAFKHCEVYQDALKIPKGEQIDVFPDIMCVGKALTGGYMTLSAVIVAQSVVSALENASNPTNGVLMHGPTFMGNPLACAVADKSLELLLRNDWKKQVDQIENQLFDELYIPLVANTVLMEKVVNRVSILGAIGIVELYNPIDAKWFQEQFVKRRVNIRPFGRLVYIMPPYIITKCELSQLTSAIINVILLLLDVN